MSLYNAKTDTGAASYGVKQFIINKFDDDLNVEASYITTREGCTCPAGVRPTCRHRQMLPMLETKANTAWFLDFDTRQWVDPMAEAASAASEMDRALEADGEKLRQLTGEDHGPMSLEQALGPQGSLGSSLPAITCSRCGKQYMDAVYDKFECNCGNLITSYVSKPDGTKISSTEALDKEYDRVIKALDSHPFRRRM